MARLLRPFTFLFLCFLLSTGCFYPHKFLPQKNPPPLPECPALPSPIRLALVLGGGGARGLAHVGVIEEFEKANIPIDLIVGCSAGSLVGALYSDLPNSEHLKRRLLRLRTSFFVDFNILQARYGLCQGKSLRQFLKNNLAATNFHDLHVPLFIVATDLYSGELVTIGGGPIIPAIEASCSIPFVFVPVDLHGRILVDGGVIDPVPVRIARKLGAEIVVAVDLRALLPPTFPTNLFGIAKRSAEITLLWKSEWCTHDADVVIRPKLGFIGTFDDAYNEIIYQAGREAARKSIPEILKLLQDRGN
jgi:NTE family protein